MKNGPYELVVAPDGYPGKKYRGKYCYEHHLIWWEETGQILNDNQIIHHKNGDKRDNRFENLELMDRRNHNSIHTRSRGVTMVRMRCPCCGSEFVREKRQTHLVKGNSGVTYCSRRCSGMASKDPVPLTCQKVEEFVKYPD